MGSRKMVLQARMGELEAAIPDSEVWDAWEAALEPKFREALARLASNQGPETVGDYLEFGVFQGRSLSCMHRALVEQGLEHVRLFGFDSFEGLPATVGSEEATYLEWKPGDLHMPIEAARENLNQRGVDWDRTTLVKGWFENTLTQDLIEEHRIRKAGIVMIDCDLYSSTKTALEFCAPLIRDQVVVMLDDWWPATLGEHNAGERRAFEEFLEANPDLSATELESYRPEAAKVFLVSRNGEAMRDG